jgi:hypothetical protein
MSRTRSVYTPKSCGWVSLQDRHSFVLAIIDCTAGGAQESFQRLCQDLERAGWTLEERVFDTRFVRREGVRWFITIYPQDPRIGCPSVLVPVRPR